MDTLLLNLPDEDPDRRVAWLAELVRPFGVEMEVEQKNGPAPISSTNTPLFAMIRREVSTAYPGALTGPVLVTSSYSDSRFLRHNGITAYGMWPFPVDYYGTMTIHGRDERVRVPWFEQGVQVMRSIVRDYCLDAGPG